MCVLWTDISGKGENLDRTPLSHLAQHGSLVFNQFNSVTFYLLGNVFSIYFYLFNCNKLSACVVWNTACCAQFPLQFSVFFFFTNSFLKPNI